MNIIRKPMFKYSCWLPKAERISWSHNLTPTLLMRPLNVWVHLEVQIATLFPCLFCRSTQEQKISSFLQVRLNWSWTAEMWQHRSCQTHTVESQIHPERPTPGWFVQHCGRKTSAPRVRELSSSDLTLGSQGYDGKLLWWWRTKKITACWRNDCQETCCFWSREAPGPGPWGAHSCAGGPPSSPSFHVIRGAASNVKATSLCSCMPKSAHNTKEKFFLPFFPQVFLCSCAH